MAAKYRDSVTFILVCAPTAHLRGTVSHTQVRKKAAAHLSSSYCRGDCLNTADLGPEPSEMAAVRVVAGQASGRAFSWGAARAHAGLAIQWHHISRPRAVRPIASSLRSGTSPVPVVSWPVPSSSRQATGMGPPRLSPPQLPHTPTHLVRSTPAKTLPHSSKVAHAGQDPQLRISHIWMWPVGRFFSFSRARD